MRNQKFREEKKISLVHSFSLASSMSQNGILAFKQWLEPFTFTTGIQQVIQFPSEESKQAIAESVRQRAQVCELSGMFRIAVLVQLHH